MAPVNSNWLSFSLSPMEMISSSSNHHHDPESQFVSYENSSSVSPNYFVDNFYADAYGNTKSHVIFTEQDIEAGNKQPQTQQIHHHHHQQQSNMADSYNSFTNYFNNPQIQSHQTVPKLEDFFNAHSGCSMVRYSDSQTDTQDSTLTTQIYEQNGSVYYRDQQDLKAIAGMQAAFSTNSGSEVEDSGSGSMNRSNNPMMGGHSIEPMNEMGFSRGGLGGLSLGVNQSSLEKAIVPVAVAEDSNCSNKKVADTFGQRTSIYRGVTRHRWTGRYEAHLWDNSCRREGQARKGRQVYLGGYDKEDKAARAYDLAALKYWAASATTNFPVANYAKEVEEMKHMTKQEFIASLRRKSSGFSRGASIYRGVTRHHQQGRWQARIGRVAGNKDLYLGTFATEEEAAEAYDIAAIKFRGINAVTNFEMNRYDVEAISNSALPIGGAAKRLKLSLESEQKHLTELDKRISCSGSNSNNNSNNISFAPILPVSSIPYGIPFDSSTAALYQQNFFQHFQFNSGNGPEPTVPASVANPSPEFYLWPHQNY